MSIGHRCQRALRSSSMVIRKVVAESLGVETQKKSKKVSYVVV